MGKSNIVTQYLFFSWEFFARTAGQYCHFHASFAVTFPSFQPFPPRTELTRFPQIEPFRPFLL